MAMPVTPDGPNANMFRALRDVNANLELAERKARSAKRACPKGGGELENALSSQADALVKQLATIRDQVKTWVADLGAVGTPTKSTVQAEMPPSSPLPMLSPVNSPEASDFLRTTHGQGDVTPTPPDSCSSDRLPPTPKLAATPSTCDVMRYVGGRATALGSLRRAGIADGDASEDDSGGCGFAFPSLTPGGNDEAASSRPRLSLSSSADSPDMPYLDSTPTTTIQLSPSHFTAEELGLEGASAADQGAGSAAGGEPASPPDVEARLMESLCIAPLSCGRARPRTKNTPKASGGKHKAFDLKLFPPLFREGDGAHELTQVHAGLSAVGMFWLSDREAARLFPGLEMERVVLYLDMLASRGFAKQVSQGNATDEGVCWKLC